MEEVLVHAPCPPPGTDETVIEYDLFSAGCTSASVEVGLLLKEKLSLDQVTTALEKTLQVFPFAAGRQARRAGKVVLVGNNGGIPLSRKALPGAPPSFARPLPVELFDVVRDCGAPPMEEESVAAGAVVRLLLTDFSLDGDSGGKQALGVSFSHGVMDFGGAGMFLSALAANCRGEAITFTPQFDRVSVLPRSPGLGERPLSGERGEAPETWQAMHETFAVPEISEPVPMAVVSLPLNHVQCGEIKERMAKAADDGVQISTNDALVAELRLALGAVTNSSAEKQQQNPRLQLVIGLRDIFPKLQHLWGNAVFTQGFSLPPSEAAASELRKLLPTARAQDYIAWKFGQAPNARGRTDAGDLVFNNWAKALDVGALNFGGGAGYGAGLSNPCVGFSIGVPRWKQLAATFGKFRVVNCVVTSTPDGVMMSVLTTLEDARVLVDQDSFDGATLTEL